jgi:hypothetical protein
MSATIGKATATTIATTTSASMGAKISKQTTVAAMASTIVEEMEREREIKRRRE